MAYYRRTAPPRKTEAERTATHEALFGAGSTVPPRQYRFRTQSANLQTDYLPLLLLLGAGGLIWFLSRR